LFSACFSVNKIILERNLPGLSDFLKKSGLNHILKDKSLSFSWAGPYSYVAEGNRKIKILVNKYRRENGLEKNCEDSDYPLMRLTDYHQSAPSATLNSSICRVWSG